MVNLLIIILHLDDQREKIKSSVENLRKRYKEEI